MTDYKTIYGYAEAVRDELSARLLNTAAGDLIRLEIGSPRPIDEEACVAVILRDHDGARLPFEILVYENGLAIAQESLDRTGDRRLFIERLRSHVETDEVAGRVAKRAKSFACRSVEPEEEIELCAPSFGM